MQVSAAEGLPAHFGCLGAELINPCYLFQL